METFRVRVCNPGEIEWYVVRAESAHEAERIVSEVIGTGVVFAFPMADGIVYRADCVLPSN